MEIIKAVLFGIVEGITEWLPVSSTGHMILLDEFIQLKGNEEFINVFLVVIQLGAIFAVVLQFWNQLFPFQWKDKRKPFVEMDKMILWGKILLACIPAAIIGILFDSVFEELFYHAVPVAVALIVFGIAFIIIERWNKGRKPKIRTVDDLTVSAVLIIGVFSFWRRSSQGRPVRGNDRRSPPDWGFQKSGVRVYLFPGCPGNAWGKSSESSEIWICV